MYHRLEHYQERIPDFWLENEPRPHVHGDMGPNADQLHRHYSKYEDYATSEFITDPPSNEESDKASPIGQDTNEYEKWSRAKALSPSETLSLKQTPLDPFDFFPDNPFGFENETGFGFGQDDIGLEEFQGKVRDNVEAEEDPFKNIATRKPTTEISSDKNVEKTLDLFEKEKAEISRPQEGFIPEEFPPGGDSDLLGKNRPNEPFPDLTKGDRIDEATLEDFRKLPDGLSRTGSSDENPPSNEESDKTSPVGQGTNEYEKWSRDKALSSSEMLSLKQTPLDPFDFFPDNPFGFENETEFGFGQDDIGLEGLKGKVRDNVEAEEDPFTNIATRKPTTEISSGKNVEKALDLFEKEKAEISRPQEGFIPEEFPPGGDSDLLGKNRPNEPFPDLTKGDRIDEATLEDFRKLPDGLSRTEIVVHVVRREGRNLVATTMKKGALIHLLDPTTHMSSVNHQVPAVPKLNHQHLVVLNCQRVVQHLYLVVHH
uniref:Uncharacterized protein n=1 Tax=Acrobeloides nanus TaxID=290746 RepID=A0A914BWT7_9BILA